MSADLRLRAVRATIGLAAALLVLAPTGAAAQAIPADGRFALFTNFSSRERVDGESTDFTEVIARLSISGDQPGGIFEYAIDGRFATYPSSERDERASIYEAFIGLHTPDRRWNLRLGQMWLGELGGLASVGGVHGEYRQGTPTAIGRWRFGLFAGLELDRYQVEYLDEIRKGGVYAALDGDHGRQHILGYVLIENHGLTERSVVVFNNFIPFGKGVTLYQALQYDTEGPAELGEPELSYIFGNLRWRISRVLELQGTYHRGQSVDARTITDDVVAGRPVDPAALDGLLYESARARVMVRPLRWLSVWAGYSNDKNNREDETGNRLQLGVSARRLFGVPLDVTVASSQTDIGDDSYDSLWASIGYAFGAKVYLTLDYYDTLSVYRIGDRNGATIEVRPNSERLALSANLNLSRTFSLLLSVEATDHSDFEELRALTGLIIRF
ncbi:MAG: hypothetical protein MUC56_17815 [Thermoanaerobaculales bacterium]|jgi:hypothetical protein|nr:hypothetical protein [Thermoanaerobaculales bacterium]